MNTKKYLIAGALALTMSAPAMAQEVNYAKALEPITAALKAAPKMRKPSLRWVMYTSYSTTLQRQKP